MKAGNDKTGFPKIVAKPIPSSSLFSLSLSLSLPSTKSPWLNPVRMMLPIR